MSWDIRRHRRYYYRSERVGKRVIRHYIGTGFMAELVARRDAEAKAERLTVAKACQSLQAHFSKMDELADRHDQLVDLIMSGVLLGAGFHRPPHRIEWKKRDYGRRPNKAG